MTVADEQAEHRQISGIVRKLLRILLYIVIACVLLLAIAAGLTQTPWFRAWLRDYALDQANQALNAQLAIGELGGNLFANVELHDVVLTQTGDTLAAVELIAAEYDLLALLDKRLQIDALSIKSPQIHLKQNDQGVWNLTNIVPKGDQQEDEAESESEISIRLERLILQDGRVSISSPDTLLPEAVRDINIIAQGSYSSVWQQLAIDSLSLMTIRPDLELRRLQLAAEVSDEVLTLDTLMLRTAANELTAKGYFDLAKKAEGQLSLSARDLNVTEFSFLLGPGFPDISPTLNAEVAVDRDTATIDLTVQEQGQRLAIVGWISELAALISGDDDPAPAYSLDIGFDSLNSSAWLPDTALTIAASGQATLDGSGITLATARANLELQVSRLQLAEYRFRDVSLSANYRRDSLTADLNLSDRRGSIDVNAQLSLGDTISYRLAGTVNELDLSQLPAWDTINTDLNLQFSATGSGFDPESMQLEGEVVLSPSTVGTIEVDSLLARLAFSQETVIVDTLFLSSKTAELSAGGRIGFDRSGEITFAAQVLNLSDYAVLLGIDTLAASGSLDGSVEGTLNSFVVDTDLNLRSLVFNEQRLDSLAGRAGLSLDSNSLRGDADIDLFGAALGETIVDSAVVTGELLPELMQAEVGIYVSDSVIAELGGSYQFGPPATLLLPDINLTIGSQKWVSQTDTLRLILEPERIDLRGLRLTDPGSSEDADTSGLQRYLTARGVYYPGSIQNFSVQAENIDIEPLVAFFDIPVELGGLLSLQIESTGSIESPQVRGSSQLADGRVNQYRLESINGEFTLQNDRVEFDYLLHVEAAESLSVWGQIPLPADTIASQRNLDVNLKSYEFTLDILRVFGYKIKQAEGDLQIELHASNTLDDPRVSGEVKVDNARIQVPLYGIDYRDGVARIRFDSSQVVIDQFEVRRDDGRLSLTGDAQFADGLIQAQLRAIDMQLVADKFFLVRHRHYETQISADIDLTGDMDTPAFSGDVRVLRSSLNLPALTARTEELQAADTRSLPFLVAALRDTAHRAETPKETQQDTEVDAAVPAGDSLIQNLRGSLRISFPRNTWLRSDQMRIEISGELEVIKQGPNFELFGSIDVVRGYYELYGKRFEIDEGSLNFQGGDSINPRLSITAIYVFRTPAREKKQLELQIGGRATSPQLSFRLDGVGIDEGDAVSYLLFGRGMDQLTAGQRSAISEDGGGQTELARGALTNLLTGQISDIVGEELALDVIEIEAQSDWQSASFLVGKYITNDLFVSYQRGVGSADDNDEIVPQIVTLEYQLSRYIFFQLVTGDPRSSGFDVIIKFEH
jgi:translocation and assembly module TamB